MNQYKINKILTLSAKFEKFATLEPTDTIPIEIKPIVESVQSAAQSAAEKYEEIKTKVNAIVNFEPEGVEMMQEVHDRLISALEFTENLPIFDLIGSIGLLPEDIKKKDWAKFAFHILNGILYFYPAAKFTVSLSKSSRHIRSLLKFVPLAFLRPTVENILLKISANIANISVREAVQTAFVIGGSTAIKYIENGMGNSFETIASSIEGRQITNKTEAIKIITDLIVKHCNDYFKNLAAELERNIASASA